MRPAVFAQALRNKVLFQWAPWVRPFVYRFYRANDAPIFVLGNQKSGTSAIAALLSEACGLSYDIDLGGLRVAEYSSIYTGRTDLATVLRQRASIEMGKQLVKEPNLTFLASRIRTLYPRSRLIFVVRDPRANIRSICNRLHIPGNLEKLNVPQYPEISPMWEAILFNHWVGDAGRKLNYVGRSAERWRMAADVYSAIAEHAELIRYEDFSAGKKREIEQLAIRLGLEVKKDIAGLVDVQYQPAGQRVRNYTDFFGASNLAQIINECGPAMERLGYETVKL